MVQGVRGRLLPCGALLVAAALAGGGCGGDEESAAQPKLSRASEAPDVFMKRTAKLLETASSKQDCAELEEVNGRSLTRFNCPASKELSKSMGGFKIVGYKEYGTGAVVDYKSGEAKDGATIVLYVAPDRKWGIGRFGLLTEPSAETSDEDSRDDFDKTLDAYLAAVRERDCAAFAKVSLTDGAAQQTICRTTFPDTKPLAKRLKRNPGAKPIYQGGNEIYGFYTLETKKPRVENSTIVLARGEERGKPAYLVLDVAPSPTAAEERRFQRDFKKQLEQQKTETAPQPGKSPARKAES